MPEEAPVTTAILAGSLTPGERTLSAMLEVVVGITSTLLVCVGIAIALGPLLTRRGVGLGLLVRRLSAHRAPSPQDRRDPELPGLNPTTQRAVQAATRM